MTGAVPAGPRTGSQQTGAERCPVHLMPEPCDHCRRYLPLVVDGALRIYDLDNPDDCAALYRLYDSRSIVSEPDGGSR